MFPSFVRRLSLAAPLSLCATQAFAQALEVQPGARIRFTGSTVGSTVTGMVLERRGDTIKVLRGNTAPFEVQMSDLKTLRISQGKNHAAGAGVGALWGAGVNLLTTIVFVASGAECGDCNNDVDGADLGLSVVSGGILGALVGVLIGKESWARVSLPSGPSGASVHAILRERQVGMTLRVAF